MNNTRCYVIIDAAASRTPQQWLDLKGAVKNKPMLTAVRQLGNPHDQPHLKVIDTRLSTDTRYALVRFIVDDSDLDAALTVLNTQCALRGITGNNQQKFAGLLQAELREAALDLGFSQTIANQLSIAIVGFGGASAITGVNAYLAANAANWGEA